MNPKISIIIPVYNVKSYLNKCVESVLAQTYKSLEVIVVDDGSTDGSGEICDLFASRDDRVKVYHQANQGLSMARNKGLDHATGDWIAFLDSDDFIEPEMYENLLELANKYNVDLCSCNSRSFYENSLPMNSNDTGEERVYTYNEVISDLIKDSKIRFEVWNKLWRRSLIDDVRFKAGQVCEDVYFDRILFKKAGKIAHIDKSLHNYLISRPGNTNSSFKIKKLCIFEEFDEWIQDLNKEDQEEQGKTVAVIAGGFAMDIYIAAVETNQEKEIQKFLLRAGKKYYDIFKTVKFLSKKQRIKFMLFTHCPKLFIFVRKVSLKA